MQILKEKHFLVVIQNMAMVFNCCSMIHNGIQHSNSLPIITFAHCASIQHQIHISL